MLPPKIARLAAFGAFGACGGMALVFLALAWITNPTEVGGVIGATGGIDATHRNAALISAGVPIALFIVIHVALGRQLLQGPGTLTEG